jgi:hypothetical protein
MKQIYFFLFFLVLILISCITIRPRKSDDGSSSLTHEDSTSIVPFNEASMKYNHEYKQPSDITFQIINAEGLNRLISMKDYSWVVIGSSWCGVSFSAMIRYSSMMKSLPQDSLQLILISQDFNLKYLKQEILKSEFESVPFLLDPVKYGSNEYTKQVNLVKDLKWTIPLEFFKTGGVPQNIILNKKSEVCYHIAGNSVTFDMITKYTGLKKRTQ